MGRGRAQLHALPLLLWTLLLVCFCCCFNRCQASSRQLLYGATDGFLDLIQPLHKSSLLQDALAEALRPGSGDRYFTPNEDVMHYVKKFIGFTILVAFGLFLVVLVPLIGIFVCGCRCCCNNCNGEVKYTQIKLKNRTLIYGYILMFFATAMFFGTLLAFVSNQLLRDQFRLQPSNSSSSSSGGRGNFYNEFSDTTKSIASALEQIPDRGRNATRSGKASFLPTLKLKLNRTVDHVNHKLLPAFSKMMRALDSGEAALDKVDSVGQLLVKYTQGHSDYVKSLGALNSAMVDVKKDLETPPFVCPTVDSKGDCDLLKTSLGLMTLNQDVSKMGADIINKSYKDLSGDAGKNLRQQLAKTRSTVASMNKKMTNLVNKANIDAQIGNLTKDQPLMRFWSDIDEPLSDTASKLREISQLKQSLTNPITGKKETTASILAYFDNYRFYACLGAALIAVLLVALFFIGMLLGCTDEVPIREVIPFCNLCIGANFLLAGAGLGFIFFSLLMLLTIPLFLVGGLIDTQFCRHLSGRDGPTGFGTLDSAAVMAVKRYDREFQYPDLHISLNVSDVIVKTPASTLLSGCTAGGASGTLSALVDTNLLFEKLQVTRLIDENLNSSVINYFNIDSMMPSNMYDEAQMRDLRAATLDSSSLDFDHYESALSKPQSHANLTAVLSSMANIANKAAGTPLKARLDGHHARLSAAVKAAEAAQSRQLAILRQLPRATKDIRDSIDHLNRSLSEANATLRHQYYKVLPVVLQSTKAKLSVELTALARHMLAWLPGQIIDCGLLADNIRRALAAPCVGILQPFNGYWAGLGFCLLALLPCLLSALVLANLFHARCPIWKSLMMSEDSLSDASEVLDPSSSKDSISIDTRETTPSEKEQQLPVSGEEYNKTL